MIHEEELTDCEEHHGGSGMKQEIRIEVHTSDFLQTYYRIVPIFN
jgi:hypothetical protein